MANLSCGHEPSPHGPHTTGTAHTPNGREICWGCADNEQRESLKTEERWDAYLSSDGKQLTTWTGGKLADVTELWWRDGVNFGGTRRYYFRARDVHGQRWHGTSPGHSMYARMRRSK